MPAFTRLSVPEQLDLAGKALTNGAAADLQERLGPKGYGPDKLAEGQAVLDAAAKAQSKTYTERGEAKGATVEVRKALKAAHKLHAGHVLLARTALREEPGLRAQLRLDEARAETQVGFTDQAGHFYARALASPAIAEKLAALGLTEAELQAGQAAVAQITTTRRDRAREKGESQDATDTRGGEVEALEKWIADYRNVASVAFADRPELMERLGFVVRSGRGG